MLSGILLGIFVGLIMGLTGAGGGILAVPALIYGMGLTLSDAKPIALIAVGLAALVGSIHGLKRGLVRYRAALLMVLVGLATVPLGVFTTALIGPVATGIIYVIVMMISGIRMLTAHRELDAENTQLTQPICPVSDVSGRFIWSQTSAAIVAAIGALAGFFTGLLGVGGGFVIVPALLAVSNLSLNSVVATSLTVITLNAIVTVSLTLHEGIPLTIPLWLFIGCAVIGLVIGRRLTTTVPDRWIRYAFSGLSFSIASVMLFQLID
jgi:uncharacterized membrane protein YfcA